VAAVFERLAAKAVAVATSRVRQRLTQDSPESERAALDRSLQGDVDFGIADATALVGAVANHNARQMRRSLRAARPADEAESLAQKIPELSRSNVRRHARRTLAEVRSLTEEISTRIAPAVEKAVSQGLRAEVLAQELTRQLAISKKRALRLAIEQVIRINSAVTQERHEKLGITEYDWHAVDDQHTRRWHRLLHKTRQRYDSPPMGGGGGPKDRGHPGTADVCRCQALPVIPA
jgi:SPP1 gp7 family putative phage head morphogenesis protein